MHARRVLRGIAATLLSAALVAGGALGTPALAVDEPVAAGLTAEPLTSEAPTQAAQLSPEQVAPEAPEADLPDADDAGAELDSSNSELLPSAPEAGQGAADAQDPVSEGGAQTEDAAPEAEARQDDTVAPVAAAVALKTTIAPKKHLAVEVSATGIPEDTPEFSAALIKRGDEVTLEKPNAAVPALLNPAPKAVAGTSTFTLTADVGKLVAAQPYVVVIWPTGEKATAETIIARADVSLSAAQWEQLFGPPAPVAEVGSLNWGVLERFRNYVLNKTGDGQIRATKPASFNGKTFTFPQVVGGKWNASAEQGSAAYAGTMRFTGHNGGLDLNLSNPVISVKDSKRAELSVTTVSVDRWTGAVKQSVDVIASIDLSSGSRKVGAGGSVRWTGAQATLTHDGHKVFQEIYPVGEILDPISFTVGSPSDSKPVTPPKPKPGPGDKTKPAPKPLPPSTTGGGDGGAQAAGSLSWGVSSAFSKYVTGPIAKGAVTTSGVGSSGGGYLFPQAAGGSWDVASQTGTVQYSGVISYTGHKGLLSESMANPMIQVTGPDTGVIYSGGAQWGTLNLGAATKSVGANGEVTWSGVPVSGGFSGGASGSNQYTLGADPLTFTVGAASGVSYGGTEVSNDSLKRTAAPTAPTTSGIRILTNPKKLVPGGEIELEAPGFTAKEREALVVLYPGVVVLDEAAGADASGTVRWLGTIPEDLPLGEYVITIQGSTDAGAVFEVRKPEPKAKAAAKQQRVAELAETTTQQAPAAAGVLPEAGAPAWIWWTASLALLAVAGTMGGLVVAQRKRAAVLDAAGGTH